MLYEEYYEVKTTHWREQYFEHVKLNYCCQSDALQLQVFFLYGRIYLYSSAKTMVFALALGKCVGKLICVISEHIFPIKFVGTLCKIALRWM